MWKGYPIEIQPIQQSIYFRGFNGLRIYAAISVVVQHISYSPADWFGVPLLNSPLEYFFLNGTDAVNLFFVLSGFLITYLLLNEHAHTGQVNIRHFYIRRVLRIFPVYYLMIFTVLLLFQSPSDPTLLVLVLFFLNNLAFVLYFPFPPLEHLWSIAAEEQYYLVAPLLARYPHKILVWSLRFVAVWWAVLIVLTLFANNLVLAFMEMSRFDFIALGGIVAYLHYHQAPVLRWLRWWPVQLAAFGVMLWTIMFTTPTYYFFQTTPVTLAFVVMIYNMAAGAWYGRLLDRPFLDYMGNLSYSLYVYHPLFVLIFYALFYDTLPHYDIIAYPVVIGVALLASWMSYRYVERPIMKYKKRFSVRSQSTSD